MRIKEGYSWHFPELAKLITDNETYIKLVAMIGDKSKLKNISIEDLNEVTGDEYLS